MGMIIKDGIIYGNQEPHPEFIEVMPNAGFHNSIFRGKYLGASFTEAQSNVIKAGTFDDLFVGDYWTINGVNWRIADFDAYYRTGQSGSRLGHHIVVVPDNRIYDAVWSSTTDTSSGYVDSAIRTNIKAASASAAGAEEKVIAAFGSSHVLSYRALYPTTYSSGVSTAFGWTDARVELMDENAVYGSNVFACSGWEVGIDKHQFSLFRLSPQFINTTSAYWLRTLAANNYAARVTSDGYADRTNSTNSYGVRPFALIA